MRLAMKQQRASSPAELRAQLVKNVVYYSKQTSMYFDIISSIATGTIADQVTLAAALRVQVAMIHESGDVERLAEKLCSKGLMSNWGVPAHLRPIRGWPDLTLKRYYVLGCAFTSYLGEFVKFALATGQTPEVVALLLADLLASMAQSLDLRDRGALKVFGNYTGNSNLF